MFVVEQGGKIKVLDRGTTNATAFLDLTSLITSGGERGLLGLAFHPQYLSNGAFYVFYTRAGDGALTIARYLRSANAANIADPASGAVILTIAHPNYANSTLAPAMAVAVATLMGMRSGFHLAWASCCAWPSMAEPATAFRPPIHSRPAPVARRNVQKSGPTACVIRGSFRLTAAMAISSSVMSGRAA
jgi:hypothetical protein